MGFIKEKMIQRLRGNKKSMVKINISVEGEDLKDIIGELFTLGTEIVKSNKKQIRELLEILGDEALTVLMKREILKKGAKLYKDINNEINYTYRKS